MSHDPQILVKREYTRREIADAQSAPVGPASGHLAGGHVLDLAALGKLILLCDFCDEKFVPKGVGYVRWNPDNYCVGQCDGCKQFYPYSHAFIPEVMQSAVGKAYRQPRRRGRWSQ